MRKTHPSVMVTTLALLVVGLLFVTTCPNTRAGVRKNQITRAISNLQSGNWHTRWRALQLLGMVENSQKLEWKKLVGAVANCLKDNNPMVRSAAAATLGAFGKKSLPALPLLSKSLHDTNQMAGLQAALTMGRLGPGAWPSVKRAAKHPSLRVKKRIAVALPGFGIRALPLLVELLGHTNPGLQVNALQGIAKLAKQPGIDRALPLLLKRIRAKDAGVQRWSLQVFKQMGTRAKRAVPALQELLKKATTANLALNALGHIGPAAIAALPAMRALAETSGPQRCAAIEAIGKLGPGASAAVPLLTRLLKPDTSAKSKKPACVAAGAIVALGQIGKAAESALPALRPYLQHPDGQLIYTTIQSIGQIGAKPALSVAGLRPLLRHPQPTIQIASIRALAAFPKAASTTLGELGMLLRLSGGQGNSYTQTEREDAILGTLKVMGLAALPAYAHGLQSRSLHVRKAAIAALCAMGPAAAPARAAIAKATGDPDHSVRFRAIESIGLMGAAGRPAQKFVLTALQDKHHWVRYYAIRALVQLRATGARPAIQALRKDKSPFVRSAAVKALIALTKALNKTPVKQPASKPALKPALKPATKPTTKPKPTPKPATRPKPRSRR